MWLTVLQIFIGFILTGLILLQAKGTGLSTAFGGQSQLYHAKRGVEKLVFRLTLALTVAFVVVALFNFRL